MKKTFMSLGLVLIVILALSGCYEWPDPIYDPDEEGLPVPTISSVDKTTLLGGIDQLTITGSGFGTVEEEVLVYFKKGTTVGCGRTLNVTDTEVIVEAPAVYSDSLEIWLDRIGCFEYAIYDETPITVEKGLASIPIVTPLTFNKVAINENAEMTVALGSSADMFHISADDSVTTISDVSFSNSLNVLSLRTKGSDIYYTLREYVAKYNDGSLDRSAVNGDKNPLNDFVFASNGRSLLCGIEQHLFHEPRFQRRDPGRTDGGL
ncbi:MAG: IPT/TIG domain-containing protein [Candidatus Marinimicrobia bacterium]|nr:IPT/TIG domain-containing protein [Candidatus Neomarinimicrobiota bacterium]